MTKLIRVLSVLVCATTFAATATAETIPTSSSATLFAMAEMNHEVPELNVTYREDIKSVPIVVVPVVAKAKFPKDGATASASSRVSGTGPRVRAKATATRGPFQPYMAAGASATITDHLVARRGGDILGPDDSGYLSISWRATGKTTTTNNAQAFANYSITAFDPTTSEVFLDKFEIIGPGDDAFTDVLIQKAHVAVALLSAGTMQVTYRAGASVGHSSPFNQGESATADMQNTLALSITYLDEFGQPDPTVTIESELGFDYTVPVPEPGACLLMLLGATGTILVFRRDVLRTRPRRQIRNAARVELTL